MAPIPVWESRGGTGEGSWSPGGGLFRLWLDCQGCAHLPKSVTGSGLPSTVALMSISMCVCPLSLGPTLILFPSNNRICRVRCFQPPPPGEEGTHRVVLSLWCVLLPGPGVAAIDPLNFRGLFCLWLLAFEQRKLDKEIFPKNASLMVELQPFGQMAGTGLGLGGG